MNHKVKEAKRYGIILILSIGIELYKYNSNPPNLFLSLIHHLSFL